MAKTNIGVLVSGDGSNLQAIIASCKNGVLKGIARIVIVISNKPNAYGLKRAQDEAIESVFVDRALYKNNTLYCAQILKHLKSKNVGLVCLAGYTLKIEMNLISAYKGKIINIHPSLLPKFGGKGLYGSKVHEAVIGSGEKESGATVHIVERDYDNGEIIVQESVKVLINDTTETLAKKVLAVEHKIYPQAIKIMLDKNFLDKIFLEGQ
jgi:phosphoribosylglycinamide formyltransferase-1